MLTFNKPLYEVHYIVCFIVHSFRACMYYAGVRDRSGFNLTYLSTGRKYDAGVLELGHDVTDDMVVPGRAVSFSIFGECHPSCTLVIFWLLAADRVV